MGNGIPKITAENMPFVHNQNGGGGPWKPAWVKILEGAIIAVLTAVMTTYVNQKVMETNVNHIKESITEIKIRQDRIHSDLIQHQIRHTP